ncbi:MAG: NAD(+) diphosphatase [Thermomicrobiales bacterium]
MDSNEAFVAISRNEELAGRRAYWFLIRDFHPLVAMQGEQARIPVLDPDDPLIPPVERHHCIGHIGNTPCFAAELPTDFEPPEGMEFINLRPLHAHVGETLWSVAGRAVQIIDWARTHRFCGRCGVENTFSRQDRSLRCPNCNLSHYPRLSPAVIVLVQRDGEILLGRSNRFPNAFYSVLAGFVEPGESLEQTVAREVFEETGIRVKDIQYFGSQPWPFPNSLMIGFTASYAGGDIVLHDDEILDANWFGAEDLPVIPGSISIARKLIDWWLEQQGVAVSA